MAARDVAGDGEAKADAAGFQIAAVGIETGESHRAHALHSPYWWLRCAISPTNDTHPLVKKYHDLLVWDMVKAPFVTRFAERVLNPVIGKSVVVYGTKPAAAAGAHRRSTSVAA